MYRIVYMSKPTGPISDEDLDAILDIAQHKNHYNAITGMLLFADGHFLQVMEGPQSKVEETFERVFMDDRHKGIRIFQQKTVDSRQFPDWQMGFKRVSEKDEAAPAFFDLTRAAVVGRLSEADADDLVTLIRSFADTKMAAE